MAKLKKLADMAGDICMRQITLNLSGARTWRFHRLANDVPFVACVIFNSPSIFAYYLDLPNFLLESGMSYFRVVATGSHCFDLSWDYQHRPETISLWSPDIG